MLVAICRSSSLTCSLTSLIIETSISTSCRQAISSRSPTRPLGARLSLVSSCAGVWRPELGADHVPSGRVLRDPLRRRTRPLPNTRPVDGDVSQAEVAKESDTRRTATFRWGCDERLRSPFHTLVDSTATGTLGARPLRPSPRLLADSPAPIKRHQPAPIIHAHKKRRLTRGGLVRPALNHQPGAEPQNPNDPGHHPSRHSEHPTARQTAHQRP